MVHGQVHPQQMEGSRDNRYYGGQNNHHQERSHNMHAPSGSPYPPDQGYSQGYGNPTAGFSSAPSTEPSGGRNSRRTESSPGWDEDNFDSFTDKKIRLAFIRKVYMILMVQLMFTCAIVFLFVLHRPIKFWVQRHSWIYYIAFAVFLVTYIILVCIKKVARKWPINVICLAIFTMALTYMAAMISCYHNIEAVEIGLGVTALVTLCVSIFACQTKWDITKCGSILFVCLLVFFFFGIACMIVYFVNPSAFHNRVLQCVYGSLGALLFSAFLAYDTQLLIGGKKYELSPEDYIYGALKLYLDIVLIFIYLMAAIGGGGCAE